MPKTPVLTLRLDPDMTEWVTQLAGELGMSRSDVFRDLVQALRERRLVVAPEALPAFINDGSVPTAPVRVCLAPK